MIQVEVKLKYRDDTEETVICNDTPAIGDWITIYGDRSPLSRRYIPREAIASIEWDYKYITNKKK